MLTTERIDEIMSRISRRQRRPGLLYDRIGSIQANLHNGVFANEKEVETTLMSTGRVSGPSSSHSSLIEANLFQWAWRHSPFDKHLWRPYVVAAIFDEEIPHVGWRLNYYKDTLSLIIANIEGKHRPRPDRNRSPTSRVRSISDSAIPSNLGVSTRFQGTILPAVAAANFDYSTHLQPYHRRNITNASNASSPPIMSRTTSSCSDTLHSQRTSNWSCCPLCQETFSGKEQDRKHNCLRHIQNTHGNGEDFKCMSPGCDKTYSRLDNYKRHAETKHHWGELLPGQHYVAIPSNNIEDGLCPICASPSSASEARYASS